MAYVIGIDIGTSALKTLVVNKSGDVVESYSVSYNTAHPKSGYSELILKFGMKQPWRV